MGCGETSSSCSQPPLYSPSKMLQLAPTSLSHPLPVLYSSQQANKGQKQPVSSRESKRNPQLLALLQVHCIQNKGEAQYLVLQKGNFPLQNSAFYLN